MQERHTAIEVDLNEEDGLIRSTVRDVLEREDARARAAQWWADDSGYDGALWGRLGELGLANMAAHEELGGIGASPLTVAVMAEEFGRSAAAVPFEMHSVALALVSELANHGQANPGALDTVMSVSFSAKAGVDQRTACTMVPEGRICDSVIVLTDGAIFKSSVFEREPVATMGMNRTANLSLDSGSLSKLASEGHSEALQRARTLATILFASRLIGLGEWMLSETVSYAASRVQFGRPIGSFQAIQHKLAEMHIELEASRFLSRHAARLQADGDAGLEASRAKAFAGSMSWRVGTEAHQIHGGVGFILEHPLHVYFAQARGADALFGSVREHHTSVGRSLLVEGKFVPNVMLGVA